MALTGLSLIRFCEQQLDGKELQVLLEGWIHWCKSNGSCTDQNLADVMNVYTNIQIAEQTDLRPWENCIAAFKEISK